MSPIKRGIVRLLAVLAVAAFAVAEDCYNEYYCNAYTSIRDRIDYKPCVLETRTDDRTCYVPFKCVTGLGNPCQNGATCLPADPEFGGYYPYRCVCVNSHEGEQCQWKTPKDCVANKCHNGGECLTNEDGLFCRCKPGFGGWHCEIVTPCVRTPCPDPQGRCEEHNRGQKGRSCYDRDGVNTDRDI